MSIMQSLFVGGLSLSPLGFAFRGGYNVTGTATTVSFPSVAFGDAHPQRRIFVFVHWTGTTGTPVVTIGGISAFRSSGKAGTASTSSSYCFIADVPTGTTGTVAISGIGTPQNGVGIVVYSASVNTSIAVSASEVGTMTSATGSGVAATHTTVNNGFVYGVLSHGTGGSAVTVSSTNPNGATLNYTIPFTFPFYGAAAYPNTGVSSSITFAWAGAPTNSVSMWAFNL